MPKCRAASTSDSDSGSLKKKPKPRQLSHKPPRVESLSSDSSSESSDSSSEEEDHGPLDKENVSESKKHHRKALKKPQVKRQIILVSYKFTKASCWFPCAIDLFIDISAIETTVLESLNNNYEPDETDQTFLRAWTQLLHICPSLQGLLKNATTEKGQDRYIDALNKVSKGVSSAREHHTAVICDNILDWIQFEQSDRNKPKLSKSTTKSGRSIRHPATQRLIIPQKLIARIQESKFVEKLKTGHIPILASDFPAFLYDQSSIDADDPQAGLFEGYLLICVFFAIFFGKSSALSGKFQKNSIAHRNGMKHVTGHHIAYAAVQARFALSDKDNWQDNDDHFCYSDFYNEIVNVFEDDLDDKVILETLIFWNQLVFGNANGLGGPSDPDFFLPINADLDAELETESTVLALQAAHRARREERLAKQAARAKAKATTPEATTSVTVMT
ncbi:hypothetical protein BT96DRAFT_972955 [Gymnopus androsaceus JB14]|uniref:Uncharacterized protein n=1 Tax=Gymnopus androsaceus JB14 TaxID=1447944 RepID=A0A6A4I7F8_9AGAR|nr:hypothetical protein BT96DRAFT_972955 [Gymnopus androsaceus JB14]